MEEMTSESLFPAPKARSRYIVVDSQNQWLVCSYFSGPDQALSAAKATLRMGDWKFPDELICYQVHEEMVLKLVPKSATGDEAEEARMRFFGEPRDGMAGVNVPDHQEPPTSCEQPGCTEDVSPESHLFCERHESFAAEGQ